jgi:hypothetical protein
MEDNMAAQIAKSVNELLTRLEHAPIIKNTRELLDQEIVLHPNETNFALEEAGVKSSYSAFGPEFDYAGKYESEKHHYEMLKHGLIQKILATRYFHQQDATSRKLVFLNPISEDCISMIHWRTWVGSEPQHRMFVFIRSSDVKALLPLDMLSMLETFYSVMETQRLHPEFKSTITFRIGSAHIYLDDNRQRAEFEKAIKPQITP